MRTIAGVQKQFSPKELRAMADAVERARIMSFTRELMQLQMSKVLEELTMRMGDVNLVWEDRDEVGGRSIILRAIEKY